jgi:glycosyltransferase involved in cell wall biosynthesis
MLTTTDQSVHVELIRLDKGRLLYAYRFAEMLFDLPQLSLGAEAILDIQPGDILFMLDATWINYGQFSTAFEKVRKSGGKIITMIYDLIPIRFPNSCAQVVKDAFEPWLQSAIKQSDQLVCISQSVADDLVAYISEKDIRIDHTLDVSYIHLGADIRIDADNKNIRPEVHEMSRHHEPLFLMIGTLEPRKGHAFTLDAFEQLWLQGYNFRLCYAGKIGWNVEEIENRIRNHFELGKRLFFIEKPSDAEINHLYSATTALVTASKVEGFGLPIVEAALHHVPTIASDLPVFHEVGKTGALYFSLQSPSELANSVIAMSKLSIQERWKMADKVEILTWKESAEWLLKIIGGQQVHYRFSCLEKS